MPIKSDVTCKVCEKEFHYHYKCCGYNDLYEDGYCSIWCKIHDELNEKTGMYLGGFLGSLTEEQKVWLATLIDATTIEFFNLKDIAEFIRHYSLAQDYE